MTLYNAIKSGNKKEVRRQLENYKKRVKFMLNGVYGCDELKVSLSDSEFDFAFEQIVYNAVDRWQQDKIVYENKELAVHSFLNTTIDGEVKRYICNVNGVSPHYVDRLVAIKSQGLNIWDESDVPAIKEFLSKKFNVKDTDAVFCNIRNHFSYAQPKNTKKHFGMSQLRNLIVDTLGINNRSADEVILLYYSGLDLWNDTEGIDFTKNHLNSMHPATKLRKMRSLLNQKSVELESLFTYLKTCSLPDKAQLKEKNKVIKPVTVDELLIAEVKVRVAKLVRKTKLGSLEKKELNEKCDITSYYGEVLKELHAHGLSLWKDDLIDLASIALLVYPECKKPCQLVQKLMMNDTIIVDIANRIFDTASVQKSVQNTKVATVKVSKETKLKA